MPKVRYERIVRADRERVFGIATDYGSLQRTMPRYFPSVRIRSSRDNVTVIEEHVIVSGTELVMMTKHVATHPTLHEVFVIGGDAKGSRVVERYHRVAADGGGGSSSNNNNNDNNDNDNNDNDSGSSTRIVVEADIKLKGAMRIAGFFGRSRIRSGLAEITDEFARLAENR